MLKIVIMKVMGILQLILKIFFSRPHFQWRVVYVYKFMGNIHYLIIPIGRVSNIKLIIFFMELTRAFAKTFAPGGSRWSKFVIKDSLMLRIHK